MLIKFAVSNFLSFKDRVEFSMEKTGKSRQHPENVSGNILRGACVYGGNNSGKTNLIKAIDFIVRMFRVGDVTKEYMTNYTFIPNDNSVSTFEIVFKQNKNVYKYMLSCDATAVFNEELYVNTKTLFKRKFTETSEVYDYGILKDEPYFSQRKFLKTDTLLHKLYQDNVLNDLDVQNKHKEYFKEIYDWFHRVYCIKLNANVTPGAVITYLKQDDGFKECLEELLQHVDPSITKLGWEEIKGDSLRAVATAVQFDPRNNNLNDENRVQESVFVRHGYDFYSLTLDKNTNEIKGEKLYTYHNNERFEIEWESAGTKKIIELALAFYLLETSDAIALIDELDSSLHSVFVRYLLAKGLHTPKNSQLIVTLHDIYLLSQQIWRIDQIWFTEKDFSGVSRLYSLQQYAPRFDKNVAKDYLEGKYGAIPAGLGVWKW